MELIGCSPATLEDVPLLAVLMGAFYAEEDLTFGAQCAEAMRALIGAPELGRIYLVRVNGAEQVAGYFVLTFGYSLERGGKVGLLDELYVAPAARGRGVGTQSLAVAMSVARREGCRAIVLEVDRGNAAARRLYERHGFDGVGRDGRDVLVRML